MSSVFSTEFTPPHPGPEALQMLLTHLRNGQRTKGRNVNVNEAAAPVVPLRAISSDNVVSVFWVCQNPDGIRAQDLAPTLT